MLRKVSTKQSIYSFSLNELRDLFLENGLKKFAADQVYDWCYRKLCFSPDEWSNISKGARLFLKDNYAHQLPEIVWNGESVDGTIKFLFKMSDGQTVESVLIKGPNRLTQCLSTQVGCAIGCTFCHTATMGLKRHLSSDEIVGQFLKAKSWLRENKPELNLTNIVYMGQGEPLHNFNNTKKATEIFMEGKGIALGQRKITLSTSGLVPQIKKLVDFPPVNIAISLHSARDNVRTELMPINKVYDLKRLFEAIKEIPLKAHRRITYEYLLIDGLNNGPEDVEALANLLHRKESKINLIPFIFLSLL